MRSLNTIYGNLWNFNNVLHFLYIPFVKYSMRLWFPQLTLQITLLLGLDSVELSKVPIFNIIFCFCFQLMKIYFNIVS